MTTVILFGGPFSNQKVTISKTPNRIMINHVIYARIDDPDTGESLDAYIKVDR